MIRIAVFVLCVVFGFTSCERDNVLDGLSLKDSSFKSYPEIDGFVEVLSVGKLNYGNVSDVELEFSVDYNRDQFHPENTILLVCKGYPLGYMDAFETALNEPPKTFRISGRLVPNRFKEILISCNLRDKDSTLIAIDSIKIALP